MELHGSLEEKTVRTYIMAANASDILQIVCEFGVRDPWRHREALLRCLLPPEHYMFLGCCFREG